MLPIFAAKTQLQAQDAIASEGASLPPIYCLETPDLDRLLKGHLCSKPGKLRALPGFRDFSCRGASDIACHTSIFNMFIQYTAILA